MFATNYNKDSIQKVIAPLHALEALMLTGEWYETKYNETGERQNLLRSFDLLEEEVDLVWHIQRNFSTDRSKINLANEYREVFEAGPKTPYTWKRPLICQRQTETQPC